MHFDRIIQGGTIVTGSLQQRADVGILDGRVAALAATLPTDDADALVDARGKLVLPGAIDVHDHFELPFCGTVSADGFANGSRAAAFGGVTTFIDFAIQGAGQTLLETLAARRAQADPHVCIDYGLHVGITRWDAARQEELPAVIDAGAPTFKMFMIYRSQGWQANDGALFGALRATARLGGTVGVHAENNDLIDFLIDEAVARGELGCPSHRVTRPDHTEAEAVGRAVQLAEAAGGHLYIFHLAAGKAADAVRQGQRRGVAVQAETCPQYLLLDDSLFDRPDGHHFATCPPIRTPRDQQLLWEALADGTVQVVSTDTCTFTSQQKAMWEGDFRKIPFGMPGIETLLPLLFSEGVTRGRISLGRLVELLSENPAKLFGMWPDKGTIAVGRDADLVVFDPTLEVTLDPENLHSACDYSPFAGRVVRGWPTHTYVRGRPVVEERRFVGEPGSGRYVVRRPRS
ncbi:MAG: dihydropyrimidinase [Myxococcota bacterium]|jgi:dihydropyrimidinase|nr:dihydropyrimidinase [Myxococcota bacterium]